MQTIRTTITLPVDIHEEWRLEAVRRRLSLGEMILEKARVGRPKSTDDKFAEILRKTAGAWGPATKEDKMREAKRREIELAASRKRRRAW